MPTLHRRGRHTTRRVAVPARLRTGDLTDPTVSFEQGVVTFEEHQVIERVRYGLDLEAPVITKETRRLEVEVPGNVVHAAILAAPPEDRGRLISRQLEDIIVEEAYRAYASGSGDNLGPCTVSYNDNANSYILSYTWTGGSTAVTSWVTHATNVVPQLATNVVLQECPAYGQAQLRNNTSGSGPWPVPGLVLSTERIQVINKKAQELLLQHLSEAQRKTWLAKAFFDIMAPSGRRYRLTKGYYHNVFLLDIHGKEVREYCAYAADPGGKLPVEDNLFAQMMTLMFNEREFLAKANTWDLTTGRTFVGQGRDADHAPLEAAA